LKACLYDSKQGSGGSGTYKKHSERAYLSCLANCRRAENEIAMILLRGKEQEKKKRRNGYEENKKQERTSRNLTGCNMNLIWRQLGNPRSSKCSNFRVKLLLQCNKC
jgi:hypothetical protein